MADDRQDEQGRELRYDEGTDVDFQRRWAESRHLSGEQVESAWRHGFEARERFADRPFDEVRDWLWESWRGMGEPAPWGDVEDIVRSGYERYKGAGFGETTDLASEALQRFQQRSVGGSAMTRGPLGDSPQQGDSRGQPERPPT